ncbi:COPII coat assembly protein sec-16 [Metarhizium album ARSEF 1941]|uniref:Protein transport protein sec16 n=1 Tax=Metarhizium album (strain ARSEF 1941) TaxID=1081103 RepID=A0A0B2X287_METAS|nr:COPII coat assembly protein sec-16 [Metarhizium album ARSEF 1941]KHO00354.1 COPII coat assembly protein sec-16 [Metarhizium album ARSEF 1941]
MAAEPSSTWHPAMRPNSVADVVVPSHKSETATTFVNTTAHEHTESREHDPTDPWFDKEHESEDEANAWLISEDPESPNFIDPTQPTHSLRPTEPAGVSASVETHLLEKQKESEDAAIPWLTNGDDGDGGAMLLSKKGGYHSPTKDPEHILEMNSRDEMAPYDALNQDHTRITVNEAKETEHIAKGPSVPMTQHSSSMSFARTVSHEITFGDDDDGEWNLGRSDTHVGAMPPSERTNSFPVVQPTTSSESNDILPLPSNQTLDVMAADGKGAELEGDEYMMQGPGGFSSASWHRQVAARSSHAPSRSITSEVVDVTTPTGPARFEEETPMIARGEAGTEALQANADPFGDDEENEDDFFAQVQTNDSDRNIEPSERECTTQAMLARDDAGTPYRQSTPQETIEGYAGEFTEGIAQGVPETVEAVSETEDLASKWEQAFGEGDNDDFLLDDPTAENKDVDVAAFLGSDDEGLLDDVVDEPAPTIETSHHLQRATNPYAPTDSAAHQSTPYNATAATAAFTQHLSVIPYGGTTVLSGQTSTPPQSEAAKAQSFADRSKGGYASPYDLPTDLVTKTVKPRKRPSLQHVTSERAPPPPRSASMYSPGQASPASSTAPALASYPPPGLDTQRDEKTPVPALRSKNSFFEELPLTSKPRSASRQSHRASSPGQYAPGLPQHGPPPISRAAPPLAPTANQLSTPQHLAEETQTSPGVAGLVVPPKANPYSALQSQHPSVTPPTSSSSRYSPAPVAQQVSGISISSRYSPAPSVGSRPNSSYGTGPSHSLPHLPRTSSPLAHFESSGTADGQHHDRRTSSSFEPRLNRVSSLPPTREVDEEDEEAASPGNGSYSANYAPTADSAESRYSPSSPVCAARYTPPLPSTTNGPAATLSPTKRSYSHLPQHVAAPVQASFAAPPRAQTNSPGVIQNVGRKGSKSSESGPRPSSSHASTAPAMTKFTQSSYTPITRARGQSLTNLMPPTDGREHDPLERWKGAPVMSWGVGGTFVTIFPKSSPRYAMGQTSPVIVRTVGEVKVQNIKDLDPLQDHLVKFPGPLKGKSKKKEAISWLSAGIESMEKELPDVTFHPQLSLEAKRSIERLLLWRLLRVFVEHDGVLEGSPTVDKAVRLILNPDTTEVRSEGAPPFAPADTATAVTPMQADGVDSGAIEKIRFDLLKGDRETAVWAAVDKRLWGHAMIISQTVSPDLYKRVAQEFVRKEINYPGHNNESLAALYKVLSGNFDDCVDELVPSHARAGLQLVSTENSSGSTKDAMDGLDKWLETLTLILSNRSNDDVRGLNALGKLLSSYGRAEAAHICFIFSRQLSSFGGLDDPKADFVLLGSDHRKHSDQFAKETEALQLSEIYEYGLTLAGGVTATAGAPHLAAYKLQHAMTLAEYGFRDRALQYCDAIASAIVSQTRRSPYHHPILEASVEDLLARLKQAPKEASSSWISKPTMGKVSDSMWNRFNKFVSGDEDGNGQTGSDGDNGPFARIASSPNVSRPPSTSNFDVYGSSPSLPSASAPVAGAAASRYAPATTVPFSPVQVNTYASAAQGQHASPPTSTSNARRYAPSPYEAIHPIAPAAQCQTGGSQPVGYPEAAQPADHQPVQPASSYIQQQPASVMPTLGSGGYHPNGLQESPDIQPQSGGDGVGQGYHSSSYSYEPPQMVPAPVANETQGTRDGGYEPPSFQPYGYEPPSDQPVVEGGDSPKPKKKSFMDDDEDDITSVRQPQEKSKAEKDRENEDMFRKAAEEDAKRAAASASAKKGWGFGGWFGGGKKAEGNIGEAQPGKPIKAKLGEQSSFVYDPDLKRWINKKPGAENVEAKKAAPPPPRGAPRAVSGTPPPRAPGTPPPPAGRSSVPPMPFRSSAGNLATAQSMENLTGAAAIGAPPAGISRSVSSNATASAPPSTGPPSRPATSMSNASSIDDLLGAPGPRKAGPKKARKSGRYVDVMAK